MKDVKVSIWCLTYNHKTYIRDALEGFFRQKTNFGYEVFIYDDASTDGTSDIIREYVNKYPDIFKAYISEYNRWNDIDRNEFIYDLMIKNLSAPYIALCEGDDYWTDENKLQIQYDYMEKHPECSMHIHNCQWLDCVNDEMHIGNPIEIKDEGDVATTDLIAQKHGNPPTASFFLRREVMLQDFLFYNAVIGDYPLILCAASIGKVHYNSKVMSVYRYRSNGSWTSNLTKDGNYIFQCRHNLGVIKFLMEYNAYTNMEFETAVWSKITSYIASSANLCIKKNVTMVDLYNDCSVNSVNFIKIDMNIIDMIDKYRLKLIPEGMTYDSKKFIAAHKNIVIMGTGKYSNILTEQMRYEQMDFAGYVVSNAADNPKTFHNKPVWQLDQLPFDENVGVLVGILPTDKGEIANSLQNAKITDYYIPFEI